jgi:hypothetical protein
MLFSVIVSVLQKEFCSDGLNLYTFYIRASKRGVGKEYGKGTQETKED